MKVKINIRLKLTNNFYSDFEINSENIKYI